MPRIVNCIDLRFGARLDLERQIQAAQVDVIGLPNGVATPSMPWLTMSATEALGNARFDRLMSPAGKASPWICRRSPSPPSRPAHRSRRA